MSRKISNRVSKICEYCKKEFLDEPWRNRRFCSVQCKTKVIPPPSRGKSVLIHCEYCGKEKRIREANFKKAKKHCCSIKCSAQLHKKVGQHHWNWKGGKTDINHKLRQTPEYKLWRANVYKRDYWTCQDCGKKPKNIVAHHITPFKECLELRYVISNGVTLCRSCHKKRHKDIGLYTRFTCAA